MKKVIIGIVIGLLILITGVYAGTLLKASDVSYNETTVNDALNELFDIANKKGPTKVDAKEGATYKGIVYLDPTDLTRYCDAKNSVSITETKTGCMKWYIFKESSDSYTMILDHNTTALIAWNSSGSNASMKEISTALTSLTSTSGWKIMPRLITADEIATITGNSTFKSSTSISTDYFYLETNTTSAPTSYTGKYAWLYDYTYTCSSAACNIEDNNSYVYSGTNTNYIYAYWTSTPVAGTTNSAWHVSSNGGFGLSSVSNANYDGVRPVITVSKDIF